MSDPEITAMRIALNSDRRMIRVQVEVSDVANPAPFLDLQIVDPNGEEAGGMLIMGAVDLCTEVTLHLRPPAPIGESRAYRLRARLFYADADKEERTLFMTEASFRFPTS